MLEFYTPSDLELKIVLRRAARIVKRGWVRDAYALDANGDDVDVKSPDAVGFCAWGAVKRASFDLGMSRMRVSTVLRSAAVRKKIQFGNTRSVVVFNDEVAKDADEVADALLKLAEAL